MMAMMAMTHAIKPDIFIALFLMATAELRLVIASSTDD